MECATCHGQTPESASGGPHGMHAIGSKWAEDYDKGSLDRCRACHGTDWRGTVLSRAQGDRSFNIEFGNKTFWRGYQIGYYTCHLGPDNDHKNPNHAPSVADVSTSGNAGAILSISVNASDADGDTLTLRIVSQPAHGAAWFAGSVVSYRSDPTFEGIDAFTVAASDGMADSNLATVTVTVVPTVVDGIFADGFESGDLAAWSP